jgi:hypothetical protein
MFTSNYMRFLSNRFREQLPFTEVPMRIVVRARRQREDDLVAAEEGGEGATIRVARGRKGVSERLSGNLALGEDDDRWLSDEFSVAGPSDVEGAEAGSDDDAPSAADLRKPAKSRKSDHEGFDDVDDAGDMDFDDSDAGELMEDFEKPAPRPAKSQPAASKSAAVAAAAQPKPAPAKKATSKKVAKKPAAEKPVVEKAVSKATKKPAAKATEKTSKKPAAKKPAAKKAANKKTNKKTSKKATKKK